MDNLIKRFLRYVSFDTQSNGANTNCPSTPGQLTFAQELQQEMINIGLQEVSLDENGYLMGHLPANVDYDVPAIGFVAHMDTAPDASGKNVKPQIVENYRGGDIALGIGDEVLSPIQYPISISYMVTILLQLMARLCSVPTIKRVLLKS